MDFYQINEVPGEFAGLHPVAAAAVISSGGLVALGADGNAVNAASTVTGHVIGRSMDGANNSAGAAGDATVLIKRGVFVLQQDASFPVAKSHVGKMVYATAPDTVASQGTCRAGVLIGFSPDALPIVDTTRAALATAAELA